MNYLITNSINSCLFTLTENCSLSTPKFLFSVTSHQTKNTFNFIAADTSTATTRYNKFNIILTSSTAVQNLTAGTVYLDALGDYSYKIYEQSSTTNLIPSAATSLVEVGLFKVSATTRTMNYNSGSTSTSVKFKV